MLDDAGYNAAIRQTWLDIKHNPFEHQDNLLRRARIDALLDAKLYMRDERRKAKRQERDRARRAHAAKA